MVNTTRRAFSQSMAVNSALSSTIKSAFLSKHPLQTYAPEDKHETFVVIQL